MTRRPRRQADAYASNFFASSPGGGGDAVLQDGIYLPLGLEYSTVASGVSVVGVANQQQFWEFCPAYNVKVSNVTFSVTTLLAGSFCGWALYSADLSTKLASADAISCATAGTKRIALNQAITLLQNTYYWLGFVATDGTTLQFQNSLEDNGYVLVKNAGATRQGRDTVDATAGGVTLAAPVTRANITPLVLRIPCNYWD